jgi:hypothetical protein
MSVAEFVISVSVAVCALTGLHELFRIQHCRSSLEVVAHVFAARNSYQGLFNVIHGTFSVADGKNIERKRIENKVEQAVRQTLKSPMLRGWNPSNRISEEPVGLRVWISGPELLHPNKPNEVKIHVCISSWLEPLFGIIADRRNCLGQFSSGGDTSQSRGLSISVSATRAANITIPPYLRGTVKFENENP